MDCIALRSRPVYIGVHDLQGQASYCMVESEYNLNYLL
jgi:hypothetical protein